MPTVNQSKTVPYSAEQMYDLVNNINDYHHFLPGCVESFEDNRTERSVEGTLVLAAPGIKKAFSTRNTLLEAESISMTLLKGPFKSLDGQWHFKNLANQQSCVSLSLRFEFNSKLLALAFGPLFSHLCHSLTRAFCDRARSVYGNKYD
jgi:ribosome-associated toxin RatA of RatAB toxin-antitoxin module